MPKNAQWLLAARPQGIVSPSNFEWRETEVPELAEGQARVRVVYLSLDPTNRIWMEDRESYLPKLELGEVMRGVGGDDPPVPDGTEGTGAARHPPAAPTPERHAAAGD